MMPPSLHRKALGDLFLSRMLRVPRSPERGYDSYFPADAKQLLMLAFLESPPFENPEFRVKQLLCEAEIIDKVSELGRQIAADYRDRPLTILGVLTGSIILLSDLIRRIDLPLRVGLIQASSYRGATTSPGGLSVNAELVPDIGGRDVLLVDDIFDTGRTLDALLKTVAGMKPRSVRSAVLLWKAGRTAVEIEPDYHCFRIPDVFVVGYGLDYNDEYRHLPDIAVLEDDEL